MFEWEAGFGYFLSSSMMKTTNAIKWELPKWSFFMVFLVTLLLKFMTNFYSFLGTCFCIIFMSVFPQGGLPLSCSSTHERGITPSWPFCRIISYVLLELHMKEGLWYQDPSSVFCSILSKSVNIHSLSFLSLLSVKDIHYSFHSVGFLISFIHSHGSWSQGRAPPV